MGKNSRQLNNDFHLNLQSIVFIYFSEQHEMHRGHFTDFYDHNVILVLL